MQVQLQGDAGKRQILGSKEGGGENRRGKNLVNRSKRRETRHLARQKEQEKGLGKLTL